MKHKIRDKKSLGSNKWIIEIELIPETINEKQEIKLVENIEANDEQRERITNYLLFCLADFTIYKLIRQQGCIFLVEALFEG